MPPGAKGRAVGHPEASIDRPHSGGIRCSWERPSQTDGEDGEHDAENGSDGVAGSRPEGGAARHRRNGRLCVTCRQASGPSHDSWRVSAAGNGAGPGGPEQGTGGMAGMSGRGGERPSDWRGEDADEGLWCVAARICRFRQLGLVTWRQSRGQWTSVRPSGRAARMAARHRQL